VPEDFLEQRTDWPLHAHQKHAYLADAFTSLRRQVKPAQGGSNP